MSDNNICYFMPDHNDYHSIHTVNFVLETKPQPFTSLKTCGLYRVHYIQSGAGKLHITGKIIPLKKYDVFFTFPDMPFCIEADEEFSYTYISFLGSRSNKMMEKTKISHNNFMFNNRQELCVFCQKCIEINPEIADWASESVLLYTFSVLGNQSLVADDKLVHKKNNIALIIKKYIDDNFSDTHISLNTLSTEFSYSPKYISTIFKKSFKIGINEYINTLRFQHACTLMQQGFTSISDISAQCGFSDAQYFSKVFKGKTGCSPKEYIATL